MLGQTMPETDQLLLTALTLILAKQMRVEARASGGAEMAADPVDEAIRLIQQQRLPLTARFGIRHI